MADKKLAPGQKKDETVMEYLRRAIGWLDREEESLLEDLPSVEAILEFFGLWEEYDTDFAQGCVDAINEGDDPTAWNDFVEKYKLDGWMTFPELGNGGEPVRNISEEDPREVR